MTRARLYRHIRDNDIYAVYAVLPCRRAWFAFVVIGLVAHRVPAEMSSITVPHSLMLERILAMEIVRVTERAAVNAARLRGRGEEKAAGTGKTHTGHLDVRPRRRSDA